MIEIKDSSVRLHDIVPELVLGIVVFDQVLGMYGVNTVLTSANDGNHSAKSLHYCREGKHTDKKCRAVDIRSHYPELNGMERIVVTEVKSRLGPNFDIVLEDEGGPNEHFHMEWDPKN